MRVILDALKLTDKKQAHKYLREALNFPDYYGCNLDALHDCLTELDDVQVGFVNADKVKGDYFAGVLEVFRDSADENDGLTLLA